MVYYFKEQFDSILTRNVAIIIIVVIIIAIVVVVVIVIVIVVIAIVIGLGMIVINREWFDPQNNFVLAVAIVHVGTIVMAEFDCVDEEIN